MAYTRFTDKDLMYVSTDGNYGGGDVIITSFSEFTEEQMDIIDSLGDYDRFWYIHGILNGEDVSEFEE